MVTSKTDQVTELQKDNLRLQKENVDLLTELAIALVNDRSRDTDKIELIQTKARSADFKYNQLVELYGSEVKQVELYGSESEVKQQPKSETTQTHPEEPNDLLTT